MIIPLLRTNTNLLKALPNYLMKGVSEGPNFYLRIGRVDVPYVWIIAYRTADLMVPLYKVYDKSLRQATLKMLRLLKKNKGEYVDF